MIAREEETRGRKQPSTRRTRYPEDAQGYFNLAVELDEMGRETEALEPFLTLSGSGRATGSKASKSR